MAGRSHKSKKKGKTGSHGKSPSASATASREVPSTCGARGLPELCPQELSKPSPALSNIASVTNVSEVSSGANNGPKAEITLVTGPQKSAAGDFVLLGGEVYISSSRKVVIPGLSVVKVHLEAQELEYIHEYLKALADIPLIDIFAETEDVHLYPITVKGPSGEQLELQVNPGHTLMDLQQFLLDAPETCFYTCYDLIMNASGVCYHLAEYLEIGDVADVAAGSCSLEMVPAWYDDKSVRSHVRHTRNLMSTASIHSSLSTALAMENEVKQTSRGVAELEEGLGIMEDPLGLLGTVISMPVVQDIVCVETIAFSSFNPVPGYRRLLGDLIYLDVVSAEGESYCITAHKRGFYVNSSKGNVLDAQSVKPVIESTTLVGLLRQVSKTFATEFVEILEQKMSGHPFENVPVLLPPNLWLGPFPPPSHKRDMARAEDVLMAPYGTEVNGLQRDWNEELQSCRELPCETFQERILRDRALYKVNCDFVEAATEGARAMIGQCIPPVNPTDPPHLQIFVHNNIFFSFAVDGDFTRMQQTRDLEPRQRKGVTTETETTTDGVSPDEMATDASSHPEAEKKELSAVQTGSKGATNEVPGGGYANLPPPTPVVEREQATYVSANNDLRGTKAYNDANVPGLHTLAMAIIDFRGHRVVAQSIIPGILQGRKKESLLYGSVDNGKSIAWNENFHSKTLQAGRLLHIKEHTMLDGMGKSVTLCTPVECRGMVGSDDRHYILDLVRTTPRDVNSTGPGSPFCVLRPELVTSFCQAEALERAKKRKMEGDEANEKFLIFEELRKVVFNPNVFTDFKVAGRPEDIAVDEELVRKAGQYLVSTVLLKLVVDLSSLELSLMDGPTLTSSLHARGINIRYLGQVARQAENLQHIWNLCVVEMVVRSAKHVLKAVLRETLDEDVGGTIAHFFNCLVGSELMSTNAEGAFPSPERSECEPKSIFPETATEGTANGLTTKAGVLPRVCPLYLCISPDLVWSDIQEGVQFKYQMGVKLAARKYNFESAAPFQTSDILDLQVVVKHLSPVCGDAQDLLETGELRLTQVGLPMRVKLLGPQHPPTWFRLHQGKLNEAYELFLQAFTVFQQVCGPMHHQVASCCRYLAMVLYHSGDMASAIMQQHKELIINERCLGPDHPDTAYSYGNMGILYHGLNQTELGLRHMAHMLLLLEVSCGSNHPDVAASFINIAKMYQDTGQMNVALHFLHEALKRNKQLLGPDHVQTISAAQKASEALKARSGLVQAFQAATNGNASRGSISKLAAAGARLIGSDDLPRSRATDERAIRAANFYERLVQMNGASPASGTDDSCLREVRKKSGTRGPNVRPQAGIPTQCTPPFGHLLSLSSGMADKAPVVSNSLGSSSSRGAGRNMSSTPLEGSGNKTAGSSMGFNFSMRPIPVPQEMNGLVDGDDIGPSTSGLGHFTGLDSKKKKSRSRNPG